MIPGFCKQMRLLLVVCAVTAVWSARADETAIFSAPDESSNLPSLSPRSSFFSDLTTPVERFNFSGAPNASLSPQNVPTPAQIAQWQQTLDRQKDWALMTPAEIFGVPTPEKMLGLPDRDGRANQTLTERFFERQGNLEKIGGANTNGGALFNSSAVGIFSTADRSPIGNRDFFPDLKNQNQNSLFHSIFSSPTKNPTVADNESSWPKTFQSPALSAQTDEQLAAAAEFQKLLNPRPAPAAKSSSENAVSFSPSLPASQGLFSQPQSDSIGSTFTPLSSSMQTPTSVKPLPGVFGNDQLPTTPATPQWKLQPAPWTSSQPQPGMMPQRPF